MPLPRPPIQKEFICTCFFTRNIFIKKYRIHVAFEDEKQFEAQYRQHLRMRGCSTEKQYAEVLNEIHKEILRREAFHKESHENYRYNQEHYEKLHQSIWKLQPSFLDHRFLKLAKDAENLSGEDFLMAMVNSGSDITESKVYRFPVFTEEFCQRLIEEVENFEQFPGAKSRPNTMHSKGVSLDEMGMSDEVVSPLIRDYLQPITQQLFPDWGGGMINSYKAFVVNYHEKGDTDLSVHYDNAEVTISIGLNSAYEGGHLQFGSLWGEAQSEGKKTVMGHETGHGILHCGRQLHSALPLTSGQRYSLVIWMRSSAVRNKMCPMCGQTPTLVEVPFAGEGFIPQAPQNTVWDCSCI